MTLILGGVMLLAVPLVAEEGGSQDQDKIGQLNEAYVSAFNSREPQKIAALFTADGEFTLLTGDLLSGRQQVAQGHASFFQNYPRATVSGKQLTVRRVAPGVFIATGNWNVKNGPTAYAAAGRWSTVIANKTGQWQYEAMRLMVPAKPNAAAD
jgi:uncharacterized protein (TIGR02246 family)